MPGAVCVGVGALVVNNGKVLLGRRKGSHGSGTWALPGGWLEKGEEFIAGALRELEEETGLTDADISPDGRIVVPFVSNNVMPEGVHSVTIYVRLALRTPAAAANVKVLEPDKCHEWAWHGVNDPPPQPMFIPLAQLFKSPYWRDEVQAPVIAASRVASGSSSHANIVGVSTVAPFSVEQVPKTMLPAGAAMAPAKFSFAKRALGSAAGGRVLGCSHMVVPPGRQAWPRHSHAKTEEAVYVLSGEGEASIGEKHKFEVRAGDYIAHLPGPSSERAHALRNTSATDPLEYLCLSAAPKFDARDAEVCVYPDSRKVGVYASESAGVDGLFPLDAMVPYYTGEYADGELDEGQEAKRARI